MLIQPQENKQSETPKVVSCSMFSLNQYKSVSKSRFKQSGSMKKMKHPECPVFYSVSIPYQKFNEFNEVEY